MLLKPLLSPLFLIIIGILMNIVSAIVTHYFISENNAQIELINQKVRLIETNINAQWKAKTELERKKEFILILLANAQTKTISTALHDYLAHHLNFISTHYLSNKYQFKTVTIGSTIEVTKEAQSHLIDIINDQYFEQIDLESKKSPLSKNNALLYSIAIFMQVFGLILVLSRDLLRK